MSRPYEAGKRNSLLGTVDAATYGEVDIPERGQMTAKPLPITDIVPDPRQPRRAIPAVLLDEGIDNLQTLIANWHVLVESTLETEINVQQIITGASDIDKPEHEEGFIVDFFELLSLAASIYKEGLSNPITCVRYGSRYMIETGERRWLAYCLLSYWTGSQFDTIPAYVRSGAVNPWRQAAENGARRPLNAIGMARQIAILVMDCYRSERGVDFGEYTQVVMPGECDRKYYAQVANGNTFRIPAGMGSQFLDVTGLKSRSQLSQYRSLLEIPDAIWMEADRHNWSEGKIRERVNSYLAAEATRQKPQRHAPAGKIEEPDDAEEFAVKMVTSAKPTSTIVNVDSVNIEPAREEPGAPGWVEALKPLDLVIYSGHVGKVVSGGGTGYIEVLLTDPDPRVVEVAKTSNLLQPFRTPAPAIEREDEPEPQYEPEPEPHYSEQMSWSPLREKMDAETVGLLRLLQRLGQSSDDNDDLMHVDWLLRVSDEELRREIMPHQMALNSVVQRMEDAGKALHDLIDRLLKAKASALIEHLIEHAVEIRDEVRPDWSAW
jgi:hypothetical protein